VAAGFFNQNRRPEGLLTKKKQNMKVINLFGPPGVGKSVISAAVYADLAKKQPKRRTSPGICKAACI
jgi:DNA replication protein DnaC